MNITTEELARIRAAAVGDMLGDSKALDEMGPSAVVFRLCGEVEIPMWTNEQPKVPGWYWHRCEEGVVTIRRVWKGDIERPSKIPQQWSDSPIPEPREPK